MEKSCGKMPARFRFEDVASEHEAQAAFVKWWRLYAGAGREGLLMAIPNGGARSAVTGARLKAEGVRAGVPDMFLAIPAGGYAGLWLEFKTARGRVSREQRLMMETLSAQGYRCEVCRGLSAAVECVERYLDGTRGT